jgi:hypothetical protein
VPVRRSSLAQDVTNEARRMVGQAARIVERTAASNPQTPRSNKPTAGPHIYQSFEIGRTGVRVAGTKVTVQAFNTAPHARYVDEGTPAHLIVPRSARVLRFEADGGVVFARRVNHPGTSPTGWFEKVLRAEWEPTLRSVARLR